MSAEESNEYPDGPSNVAEALRDAVAPSRRVEEDLPSPEQVEIYRRMTPGRRLELGEQLYWAARKMKAAWLRSLHPEWTDEQVAKEVTRIFSNARS